MEHFINFIRNNSIALAIVGLFLLSSCTIYQNVPVEDGIYSRNSNRKVVVVDKKEYDNYEDNYFTKQLNSYENSNNEFFTDVDSYSAYDTIIENNNSNTVSTNRQPWGYDNSDSDIVININTYNDNPYWAWSVWDPWFYNRSWWWGYRGFYYGDPWFNNWGWGPYAGFYGPYYANYWGWRSHYHRPYRYNRFYYNRRFLANNYRYGRRSYYRRNSINNSRRYNNGQRVNSGRRYNTNTTRSRNTTVRPTNSRRNNTSSRRTQPTRTRRSDGTSSVRSRSNATRNRSSVRSNNYSRSRSGVSRSSTRSSSSRRSSGRRGGN